MSEYEDHDCGDCLTTGFCAQHHVEIERRKPLKYIPELMTFMNTTKGLIKGFTGIGAVALVLIVGSYYYTQESNAETRKTQEDDKAEVTEQIKELTHNVNKLTLSQELGIQEHQKLIERMDLTNKIMLKLLEQRTSEERMNDFNYYPIVPDYYGGDEK